MSYRTILSPLKKLLLIGAIGFLVVGCQNVKTTQNGVFKIDRPQSMSLMVSSEEVEASAAKGYRQMMVQAQAQGAISKNKAQTDRVKKISDKIIGQVHHYRPDAKHWNWEMNVLETDEVNAWAMAGGKMAVYTGLLKTIKPTDDELAAIIGHEIAHALREHSRESISQEQGIGIVLQVVDIAAANSQYGAAISTIAGLGADLGFLKPHSREQESEADLIGLELMARAGYNPRAAKTLWDKMGQLGDSGPEFLSTHPSPENRAQTLAEAAEVVYPIYESLQPTPQSKKKK